MKGILPFPRVRKLSLEIFRNGTFRVLLTLAFRFSCTICLTSYRYLPDKIAICELWGISPLPLTPPRSYAPESKSYSAHCIDVQNCLHLAKIILKTFKTVIKFHKVRTKSVIYRNAVLSILKIAKKSQYI